MYNPKKAISTALTLGATGLGVVVLGGATNSEQVKDVGYLVLSASFVGAGIAGIRGMIDRKRPYSSENQRGTRVSPRVNPRAIPLNQGDRRSPRQEYLNQRREQRNQQKLDRDREIRDALYIEKVLVAQNRIRQEGIRGGIWRSYYSIRDRLF